MTTLIPTASACYTLQLPPTEKDDRLNLNVRTGSASTLYNSLVITFGGLTIGLELFEFTIEELFNTFQSKVIHSNSKFKHLSKYLSGELFHLSLIDRSWSRVQYENMVHHHHHHQNHLPRPKPRLFHELCAVNNCVYLFGGLAIPESAGPDSEQAIPESYLRNFLEPINDLWEFNLESSRWTLLHDGSNYEQDPSIPIPRFSHKMTIINSLTCVNKRDHFGIFIAGGKDHYSRPIHDNVIFDLVDKKYVGGPVELKLAPTDKSKSEERKLSVNYANSIIVSFPEEVDHHHRRPRQEMEEEGKKKKNDYQNAITSEESLIVYTPTAEEPAENPLTSFRIGKSIKPGKPLPIHRKKILKHYDEEAGKLGSSNDQSSTTLSSKPVIERKTVKKTVPFNLRYPTGGLFGQNVVITGFLPNDYDISIFIYNKPTGKWSRLNIFCNHDYGSHRFWGGFAWQSHHKVVLIGNFMTSRTTSSIRFFTLMVTVSLPITNILASSELAGGHHHGPDGKRIYHNAVPKKGTNLDKTSDESITDDSTCSSIYVEKVTDEEDEIYTSRSRSSPDIGNSDEDEALLRKPPSRKFSAVSNASDKTSPTTISFSEYVHYAAPKTNFTKIRSVFPPAAITLGRNAFDRYADLISDFEMVSCHGDRVPVSLAVLLERWGGYFIQLLARGYVQAVDKFDADQNRSGEEKEKQRLRTSKSTDSTGSSSNQSAYLSGSLQKKGKNSIGTLSSVSSEGSEKSKEESAAKNTYYISLPIPASKVPPKEPPQFRLPFQDNSSSASVGSDKKDESYAPSIEDKGEEKNVRDPHDSEIAPGEPQDKDMHVRKDSTSSFSSSNSLLTSHLQDIPPQLPLPAEQIPAVPATPTSFRQSSSRKNSGEFGSPRASLINTLTQLRNIPTGRSDSPFASPRASLSAQGGLGGGVDLYSSNVPNLRPTAGRTSPSGKGGIQKLSEAETSTPVTTPDSVSDQKFSKIAMTSAEPYSPSKHGDTLTSNSTATSVSTTNSRDEIPSDSTTRVGSSRSLETTIKPNPVSTIGSLRAPSISPHSSDSKVPMFNESPDREKLFNSLSSYQSDSPSGGDSQEYDETFEEQPGENPVSLGNKAGAGLFDNALLNFDAIENGRFKMEPSLIPRKLYMPFSTITIKAFGEYLYTGQVGNKWLLSPTSLDNLAIAKFFKVPLLYDLISEVLFGIIGRKEAYIVKEGNKLKKKYFRMMELTKTPFDPSFKFPLDEYEGFMDTVDDGYLDIALLKKSSNIHKSSVASGISSKKKRSLASSNYSRRPSLNDTEITENEENEENAPVPTAKDDDTETENKQTDSTDDSDKKTTSNSEEDLEFDLNYLDIRDPNPANANHKQRPFFDSVTNNFQSANNSDTGLENNETEEKERVGSLTLEELVAPDSAVPSDAVIDNVYESAALVVDLKLMLRAANVREMSRILTQSKIDIGSAIERLDEKYEQQQKSQTNVYPQRPPLSNRQSQGSVVSNIEESKAHESKGSISSVGAVSHRSSTGNILKPSLSSSSLSTTTSSKASSKSFRGLSGFTPFKQHKTDPRLGNKELDKRITKLIKKDEKIKSKNERERKESERHERHEMEKALRKEKEAATGHKPSKHALLSRTSSRLNLSDSASSFKGTTPVQSITTNNTTGGTQKKHHGFFHLGKKSDANSDESSLESSKKVTESSAASITSATSKNGKKHFFGLKK